ncbi:hypothetical protein QTJ16_005014 [Diplocarpon rosae]|uniref:Uncharacterized protein n=1 Tax=Diplocarpon rosae TaxID=946125 RepID=A0AAD9SZ58_9HELO|nr:hypothetical protein QTJ16_005014 [Diplocarpon rosae]
MERVNRGPPQEIGVDQTESHAIAGRDHLNSPGNPPKSTNPFRKHTVESESGSSILPSPETHLPAGTRKYTPARAVFYDLSTAHSSITSGTARSRANTSSKDHLNAPEEENSIALQDLEPAKRDDKVSSPEDLPLPPPPALLTRGRGYERGYRHDFLRDQDEQYAIAHMATPIPHSLPEPKVATFSSPKNVLPSISTPPPTHWPEDCRSSGEYDHNARSSEEHDRNPGNSFAEENSNYHSSHYPSNSGGIRNGGVGSSSYGNTGNSLPMDYEQPNLPSSSPPVPISTHPYKFSRLVSISTDVSVPEASTVGNIVQHYVGSEGPNDDPRPDEERRGSSGNYARSRNHFRPRTHGQDLMPSSPLYGPLKPSGLRIKKQHQPDKQTEDRYAQPSSSDTGVPGSSSYGHHGVSDVSHGRNAEVNDLNNNDLTFDDSTSDAANSTLPSLPRLSFRNPFRARVPHADPGHCVYDDEPNLLALNPRLPLEREVSEALRRASGCSAYSVGSFTSETPDLAAILSYGRVKVDQSSSTATGSRQCGRRERSNSKIHHSGKHRVDEQGKGFYDENAIPPTWINSRQSVRIPINRNGTIDHNGSRPYSPPTSPPGPAGAQPPNRQPTQDEDHNDWETVGESAFGLCHEDDNDSGLIGGTVGRAGSSIANTSDAGTSSVHIAELEEFGSTDRIAQHPGNIQFSGDYRQRDLKKTKMPILAPVFNGHKVNGYLADSMRVRQPTNLHYFQSPPPLAEAHKHPFNSSPPDVLSSARPARSKGILRSFLTSDGSKISGFKNEGTQRGESSNTKSHGLGKVWTDSYRQIGPSVSTQNHPFARRSMDDDNARPTSWQYIIDSANDTSTPNFRSQDGSHDPGSMRSPKHEVSLREMLEDDRQSGGVEAYRIGKKTAPIQTRIEPMSARRPPGEFYQGLRTVSNQPRVGPNQHDGTGKIAGRRTSSKTYGTKSLRPLSLVTDRQASTPISSTNPSEFAGSDFVYRSPLAPPKRSTWQRLYTDSGLFELQERAKTDGVYSSRTAISSVDNERLSRRHLYEPPRLVSRDTRQGNQRSSLQARKSNISLVVLALCALFPPLLILYALGLLDSFMAWYSDGEFYEFGKGQKKWAGIVLVVEVVVMGIFVAAFTVSSLKNH